MMQEHFGIGIVEMMAAGLYTIAHNSGGPLKDIIGGHNKTCGRLAITPKEYAQAIIEGLGGISEIQSNAIREEG